MSVLMSESFIHSFNRFIHTADSFRNEAIDCPYEWATESWAVSQYAFLSVLVFLWTCETSSVVAQVLFQFKSSHLDKYS